VSSVLTDMLEKERAFLTAQWTDAANAAYPFAIAGLIRSSRDPFANPAGGRSQAAAEALLTSLLAPVWDDAPLRMPLEEFIRTRAVQDMSPADAVGVVFNYKQIIRGYLARENIFIDWEMRRQLAVLEERVDPAALFAFTLYVQCRENLFTARLEDMRRHHSQILRLAKKHDRAYAEEDN